MKQTLCVVFLLHGPAISLGAEQRRPSFLFIVVDDLNT